MRLMLSGGAIFAGYRIQRLLGSGGMGSVYLARHPDLPRSEALKVLSAELSRDREFRARFVREADVAAGLDHPNIVSVHQRGEFDGQLWIAMQFVDGPNAGEAQRRGPWSAAQAVSVIGEVAKGLDYAHRHGVVHRDIKPANFLLSRPEAGEQRVLLGDFGIARAFGDTALTPSDSVVATLAYAAPEILSGQGGDHLADLYSLGGALFRLLTGRAPFPANEDGPGAMVAAHLFQEPPRPSDCVAGLSRRMDAVIATAMAKEPAQRFRSAHELAEAAAAALKADSTHSHTLDWVPPASVVPSLHTFDPGHRQHGDPRSSSAAVAARARLRWAVSLAAGILIAAAIVSALVVTGRRATTSPAPAAPAVSVSSSTSAAAPPLPRNVPLVPDASLPGLLLAEQQIADITAAGPLKPKPGTADDWDDEADNDLFEKDCAGAFDIAQRTVYAHTGFRAVHHQEFLATDKQAGVGQAVVAFDTAAAARQVVSDQARQWAACASRTVAYKEPGQPQANWKFGPLQHVNDDLAITTEWVDGKNAMLCQHVLGARNNVIIDTGVCRPAVANRGLDLLNAIAAKVPS
jgi:serine/threonine-protein kinase